MLIGDIFVYVFVFTGRIIPTRFGYIKRGCNCLDI